MLKHYIFKALTLGALVVAGADTAWGYSADSYTPKSALAEGRWVKVRIDKTGVYCLTPSQLRQMGFTDPSRVNVYGYGGAVTPDAMIPGLADDLPLQPVARTDEGIFFFGQGVETWTQEESREIVYQHTLNPYSAYGYYFVSDIEPLTEAQPSRSLIPTSAASSDITSFLCRAYHEQELEAPSNTGRELIGEDFRTRNQQQFKFDLTDNVGDFATVGVSFYAATTSGSSSISLTANGVDLPSTAADKIQPIEGEAFARSIFTVKEVSNPGAALTLDLTYNPGGALKMARLNAINVEYERRLKLNGGMLHFYNKAISRVSYSIEGCSQQTVIFDVTDPSKVFQIEYQLDGDKARFEAPEKGYREYVAFTPGAGFAAPTNAEVVANSDIHGMPTPDLLIISPAEYLASAQTLAAHREKNDGLRVAVLTPEQLYNEFSSGTPDIGAFRKCLKMWLDRGEDEEGHAIQYCLIFGRPTFDNRQLSEYGRSLRYPIVPIWQSPNTLSQTRSYSTDLIIGMLADTDAASFRIDNAQMQVSVGRLPVTSVKEAQDAVAKIIAYDQSNDYGTWRNTIMLIADDGNGNSHLDQAEDVYNALNNTEKGAGFRYERLYLDAYPLDQSATGNTYTIPRQLLQKAFNEGVMYMDYIGHANPKSWSHENLMTWIDITSMNNKRWPFLFAATCEFGRWDDTETSGAEVMWAYPDAGVIGMITASRTVYILNNGKLNTATHQGMMTCGRNGKPGTAGDILRQGINNMKYADENKLRYMLMGDPSMQLAIPQLYIAVDSIDGKDLAADPNAEPVAKALGKVTVTGRILDADGQLASDFNGRVMPRLYDAEKVIETLGNGPDSGDDPTMYNDHNSLLYHGSATVENGLWTATLMLPSEIDNIWTPALLNLYAYSDDGREANGSTTRLYVYGYDEDAATDDKGPEISEFYLNTPSFEDGSLVGESVIVRATVSDESGINVSQSGIGHNMRLCLDGDTNIDLTDSYLPSDTDPLSGSLSYLLTNLEAGEHSLRLIVWDNANNASQAELSFKVQAGRKPQLIDITANTNTATTGVTFIVSHDCPGSELATTIEVFDLAGRTVWETTVDSRSGMEASSHVDWDLKDKSGTRVTRGIYLYRATIETADGREASKTKKVAITAMP